jgi:hypothetical protein
MFIQFFSNYRQSCLLNITDFDNTHIFQDINVRKVSRAGGETFRTYGPTDYRNKRYLSDGNVVLRFHISVTLQVET